MEIAYAFIELANGPEYVSNSAVDVLEYYATTLYYADVFQSTLTAE